MWQIAINSGLRITLSSDSSSRSASKYEAPSPRVNPLVLTAFPQSHCKLGGTDTRLARAS